MRWIEVTSWHFQLVSESGSTYYGFIEYGAGSYWRSWSVRPRLNQLTQNMPMILPMSLLPGRYTYLGFYLTKEDAQSALMNSKEIYHATHSHHH